MPDLVGKQTGTVRLHTWRACQHFTAPRLLALSKAPLSLSVLLLWAAVGGKSVSVRRRSENEDPPAACSQGCCSLHHTLPHAPSTCALRRSRGLARPQRNQGLAVQRICRCTRIASHSAAPAEPRAAFPLRRRPAQRHSSTRACGAGGRSTLVAERDTAPAAERVAGFLHPHPSAWQIPANHTPLGARPGPMPACRPQLSRLGPLLQRITPPLSEAASERGTPHNHIITSRRPCSSNLAT
jgi:hypothetical protein